MFPASKGASLAISAGLLVLALAAPAGADDAACASFAWPLGRELSWLTQPTLASIDSGGAAPTGGAVAVRLIPFSDVRFSRPPERRPKIANSNGAIVNVPVVAKAGLYQISLSDEAWIDVVQNGERVASAAFSGKPGCAGLRKSVRFALSASPAIIQISGATVDRIGLAIAPAE
jgi:hypothetical protein